MRAIWHFLQRYQGKERDFRFLVMTYNILCQETMATTSYLYPAHSYNLEHLTWSHRWHLIQQEIIRVYPDVLCMQEVQHDHYLQTIQQWLQQQGSQPT